MHQAVILTTHELDPQTLQAVMAVIQRRRPELRHDEHWVGTIVKMADPVELPEDSFTGMPSISPHHIEPLLGKLAR